MVGLEPRVPAEAAIDGVNEAKLTDEQDHINNIFIDL